MILALFLAIVGYPLVELGKGDFDGDGKQESVYYQIIGPSAGVSVKEMIDMAPVSYDVRFLHKSKGKLETISTIKNLRFPLRSIEFKWKRKKDKNGRHSVVFGDALGRYFILHSFEPVWSIDSIQSTFIPAMVKWLRS